LGHRLEPANTDYRHQLCGKFNLNLNFGEHFLDSRISVGGIIYIIRLKYSSEVSLSVE
jgi:hypothetical protein